MNNVDDQPKGKSRPLHSTDFDINFGLHQLKLEAHTPHVFVWKSSLWENAICLVFLIIALVAVFIVRSTNPELFALPHSVSDACIKLLVAGIYLLSVWFLAAKCLHRGCLELDTTEGCLLFYRRLLFPAVVYRLPLCDIAKVINCKASDRGSGDDDIPREYKIIAAVLKTGELVSIAFDSHPDIFSKIRAAMTTDT